MSLTLKRVVKRAAGFAAVSGAVSIGAVILAVAPAQAASEDGICNYNDLCVWKNTGGSSNPLFDTRRRITHYGAHNYINSTANLGDSASYYSNRTEWVLGAWVDGSCSGSKLTMASGYDYNLGGTWLNDEMSSHGPTSGC